MRVQFKLRSTLLKLSPGLQVRKHAQNTLDAISRVYDGTKSLVYPTILASLQKGVDADQMKGGKQRQTH